MQARTDSDITRAFNYLSSAFALSYKTYTEQKRDSALLALDTLRISDTYEAIKAKLGQQELTPREYLFYALVTDNVMTVDANILDSVLSITKGVPYNLRQSLYLTIAALRFAQTDAKTVKERYHQELIDELCKDRGAENLHRSVFVNLAGIQLTGLDTTVRKTISGPNTYLPDLSFCDLRGASFTDCKFNSLTMVMSDLSDAVFRNVNNIDPNDYLSGGFNFWKTILRRTQFSNVSARNVSWTKCDFTDARFADSIIGYGCFRDSDFQNAAFVNSKLTGSGSYGTTKANFSNCDFTTAQLREIYHHLNNLSGARFIKPKSTDDIADEITRVTNDFVKDLSGATHFIKSKLAAFQEIIRKDVERNVLSLEVSDEEKKTLLAQAMLHDLFHYEFFEPTKSLVVGGVPRQETTLTLFGDYVDDEYTYKLNEHSLKLYKELYANGMTRLKEFADALNETNDLTMYTRNLEMQFIAMSDEFHQFLQEDGTPQEVMDKSASDFLEMLQQNAPEKLQGLDPAALQALALTNIMFAISCHQKLSLSKKEIQSKEISNLLGSWHPLTTLHYYKDANCLAPYISKDNNGTFHSADEMIKAFTSEMRYRPPVVEVEASPSKVSGTLFAGGDNNDETAAAKEEKEQLRLSH